jgi:signal transduction histidine kinase
MAQVESKPVEVAVAGVLPRWLRPLGLATITVVVVLSLRGHPSPALEGEGLAVTLALIVLVASIVAMVRRGGEPLVMTLAPVGLIMASAVLVWTQSGGPAIAAMFVVVGYAALRLPLRHSLAMLALAVVAFAVAAAHADRSTGLVISGELGIVAFYLLASFARRMREAHEETTRLLAELEASRRLGEEAAALQERSRIAREIHDVLAHSLSGLVLQLEGARMLASSEHSNGQLSVALDRAHHLARAGLEEARRAIGALRDEDLPGPDRLGTLTADFSRDSNVATTLEVTGTPRELDSQSSLTLFRVAQEALTNSRKHAQPQRVEVRLTYEPKGTRLVVRDHCERAPVATQTPAGGDHPLDGERSGYGLTGMRERAELIGGSLQAGPTGDGFEVELWIPA